MYHFVSKGHKKSTNLVFYFSPCQAISINSQFPELITECERGR